MNDKAQYRMERIERLLEELKYEVTRGMLENEIEEVVGFRFVVPRSRVYPTSGVVECRFETRPVEHFGMVGPIEQGPRLRLVKK